MPKNDEGIKYKITIAWSDADADADSDIEPMKAEFGMHTNNNIAIDGTIINDIVFDEELVDYKLAYRPDRVDDLIKFIGEAQDERTKELMKADLITLASWDDEFIWESIDTNEFISPTRNTERFNEICQKVLDANQDAS